MEPTVVYCQRLVWDRATADDEPLPTADVVVVRGETRCSYCGQRVNVALDPGCGHERRREAF